MTISSPLLDIAESMLYVSALVGDRERPIDQVIELFTRRTHVRP